MRPENHLRIVRFVGFLNQFLFEFIEMIPNEVLMQNV